MTYVITIFVRLYVLAIALKAYSWLSELIFFAYIKSCKYTMFYTNKMFWTKSQI